MNEQRLDVVAVDKTAKDHHRPFDAALETVNNFEKAQQATALLTGKHALSAAYNKVAKTRTRREANRFLRNARRS